MQGIADRLLGNVTAAFKAYFPRLLIFQSFYGLLRPLKNEV